MFSASEKQSREDMLRNGCCFREKEQKEKKEVSKKEKNEGKWEEEGLRTQTGVTGGGLGGSHRC